MKKYILLILIMCVIVIVTGCSDKSDNVPSITKIEIDKVSFVGGEASFDISKIQVESSWFFTDTEDIKVVSRNVLKLDPRGARPTSEDFETYHVKVYHNNEQQAGERWILWLHKEFKGIGAAENITNPQQYKEISKKEAENLSKLLKDN